MSGLIKQKIAVIALNKNTHIVLIAFIFLAVLSYIYFANAAVHTLTVLEKTKNQIQSLNTTVSDMESRRLALENELNTEKALHLGFVEINHPTFIIKGDRENALSLKTN